MHQPVMLKKLKLTVLCRSTIPFRTNTQKRCPFHYRGLECKSRKSRNTWLLLLQSRFSRVWLQVTPLTAALQALPSLGIFQARILKWIAISFSSAWKWKAKMKSLSRAQLLTTLWTAAYQAPPSMGFSRQEYWSGLPLSSLETPGVTGKFGLGVQNEAGQKANWVLPRECTDHSKHPFATTQEKTLHMNIIRWPKLKSDWLYSFQPKMEKLSTVIRNKTGRWMCLRSWTPYCQIQA